MTPITSRRMVLTIPAILPCVVLFVVSRPLAAQENLPHPTPAPAGPSVRRLTLDEARQLALANNKSLALAQLNVTEKQFGVAAGRKDYFPKVLGNVTYFRFNEDLGSVVTIRRGGGRLGLIPATTQTINAAVLNQNTTLSTVFVAQPITKLIAVNALVQIARADENSAQAQLDKGTRDLLSGVAQAYHGLLGTQRIQAALELQVKLLEQVAKAKPSPEIRIGLLEARQGVLQTRSQVQELTTTLNDLLNLPLCTVLELVDPVPADLPVRCAEEAVQIAMAQSPEVREAEQGVAKAEAALKIARMDCLPDVNVLGGYANQTVASYIQPNVGYLGIAATYTFWDWGKRREVKRQRDTTTALAHQNLQIAIDKAQLAARKAYGSFEEAREAHKLAGEMVQARKDAEKAAAGPAIAQAQAETSKAELEAMKAEITYRVAHAQLAALISH